MKWPNWCEIKYIMLHLFGILKYRTIQVLERPSSLQKEVQKDEETYKLLRCVSYHETSTFR